MIYAFVIDLLRWERDEANNPTGCSFVLSCEGETVALFHLPDDWQDYEMLVVSPSVWRHYEDCCKIAEKSPVWEILNRLQPYGGHFGIKTLLVHEDFDIWTLEQGVG